MSVENKELIKLNKKKEKLIKIFKANKFKCILLENNMFYIKEIEVNGEEVDLYIGINSPKNKPNLWEVRFKCINAKPYTYSINNFLKKTNLKKISTTKTNKKTKPNKKPGIRKIKDYDYDSEYYATANKYTNRRLTYTEKKIISKIEIYHNIKIDKNDLSENWLQAAVEYNDGMCFNCDGASYISDGLFVYPNGEMKEET